MKTLQFLLIAILFLASIPSFSSALHCKGKYENGDPVFVILDPRTNSLSVNGNVHYIYSRTRGGQGFSTENFISKYGFISYDSIVPDKYENNVLYLLQFNAKTERVIARAKLLCK